MTIFILGGDARHSYVCDLLLRHGFSLASYGVYEKEDSYYNCLGDTIRQSKVILLPIPMMKNQKLLNSHYDINIDTLYENLTPGHIVAGGGFPKDFRRFLYENKISHYDFLENTAFRRLNAIATAEGVIMHAINSSKINLHMSQILLLGYGMCGREIACRLRAFNGNITVFDSNPDAINCAFADGFDAVSDLNFIIPKKYDFVFNTVPARILPNNWLLKLKKDAVITDIATNGGFDYKFTASHNINAALYPHIPAHVSPYSSAQYIEEALCKIIYERSD